MDLVQKISIHYNISMANSLSNTTINQAGIISAIVTIVIIILIGWLIYWGYNYFFVEPQNNYGPPPRQWDRNGHAPHGPTGHPNVRPPPGRQPLRPQTPEPTGYPNIRPPPGRRPLRPQTPEPTGYPDIRTPQRVPIRQNRPTGYPNIRTPSQTPVQTPTQTPSAPPEPSFILYNFTSPNCPYCRAFEPIWQNLTEQLESLPNIETQKVDITQPENENLAFYYNVENVPTIILVTPNSTVEFSGPRTLRDIQNFIVQQMNNYSNNY